MKLIQNSLAGENRVALLDDENRPLKIYFQRQGRLNYGEIVTGRVTQKLPQINGYFILTDTGFSAFTSSKTPLTIGQSVILEITKEARFGKDAAGTLTDKSVGPAPDVALTLSQTLGLPIITETDDVFEDILTEALQKQISLSNGSRLLIEKTQVCWTIDVDSGNASLPLSEINKQIVPEIAHQIGLKNISGVIFIDFAGRKPHEELKKLIEELKKQLAADALAKILGWTNSGLIEIKRARQYAALMEVLFTSDGHLSPETVAYQIKRQLKKSTTLKPTVTAHPSVIQILQKEGLMGAQLKTNPNFMVDTFDIK